MDAVSLHGEPFGIYYDRLLGSSQCDTTETPHTSSDTKLQNHAVNWQQENVKKQQTYLRSTPLWTVVVFGSCSCPVLVDEIRACMQRLKGRWPYLCDENRFWLHNLFTSSRWWFQIFSIFIPTWGRFQFLPNIFQMGWNHQLVMYV